MAVLYFSVTFMPSLLHASFITVSCNSITHRRLCQQSKLKNMHEHMMLSMWLMMHPHALCLLLICGVFKTFVFWSQVTRSFRV